MNKPPFATVCTAIDGTFVALYGERVTWISFWAEPGASSMDLASNVETAVLIDQLRQAIKRLESGTVSAEVVSVMPEGNA